MAIFKRNCGLLLVVVVAAVCMELYQAQLSGRCACPQTQPVKVKISDFQVLEKRPGCDRTEIIVTRFNSTQKMCMPPEGTRARRLLACWERINKDESRKMDCINRARMAGNRTSEE